MSLDLQDVSSTLRFRSPFHLTHYHTVPPLDVIIYGFAPFFITTGCYVPTP